MHWGRPIDIGTVGCCIELLGLLVESMEPPIRILPSGVPWIWISGGLLSTWKRWRRERYQQTIIQRCSCFVLLWTSRYQQNSTTCQSEGCYASFGWPTAGIFTQKSQLKHDNIRHQCRHPIRNPEQESRMRQSWATGATTRHTKTTRGHFRFRNKSYIPQYKVLSQMFHYSPWLWGHKLLPSTSNQHKVIIAATQCHG